MDRRLWTKKTALFLHQYTNRNINCHKLTVSPVFFIDLGEIKPDWFLEPVGFDPAIFARNFRRANSNMERNL